MTIPQQNTDGWVEWRRKGVGASELGVLVGEDPYRSEFQLALEKRGEVEDFEETWPMRLGHLIQPAGVEAYAEATGHKVRNVHTTQVSKDYPHVFASLDGRVVGERRGIEIKWTGRGWDEPPRRVVLQCMGQMGVCRLDAVDVVLVTPYNDPRIFPVERDDALVTSLMELAEGWYRRYVIGDELPPMDGSRAASRHLDRQRGEAEAEANEYQAELLQRLRGARQTAAEVAEDEKRITNLLKESMAGTGVLRAPGARVTWAPVKGRVTTDWRSVAQMYRSLLTDVEPERLDEMEQRHVKAGEPTTRFAVKYEEE